MLTRGDVGHRIAIRRIVTDGEGRERFAELVGELTGLTATEAVISTRSGRIVVPLASITAGRRVPDRRGLTATERLEHIASTGWPPKEQHKLGEWLLRAADGWTARANSALPIGVPGVPLPEAIDMVVTWYTARNLPPAISVPEPVGRRLTAELTRRGWLQDPQTLLQTAELATIAAASVSARPEDTARALTRREDTASVSARRADVRLDLAPSRPWLDLVAGMKGELPPSAVGVITGVGRSRFARIAEAGGSIAAIGRGVIAADGEWLGISLVDVLPSARRCGLATAVIEALAAWARAEGAQRAYLQVLANNIPAVALYAKLGFKTHHRYATWRLPPR